MFRRELTIHKNPQKPDQTEQPQGHMQKKKERNENKIETSRWIPEVTSINNYDAKKLFVTKASDNRTCETYAFAVYTLICSHKL